MWSCSSQRLAEIELVVGTDGDDAVVEDTDAAVISSAVSDERRKFDTSSTAAAFSWALK